MASSVKAEGQPTVSHHGNGTTTKAAPARKGFFRRWWWLLLLIGLIIAAAVVVPCVILIAVPKIAQDKLNAANLQIDGIVVTNTESASYNMAINSTITTDGGVHANVDAFNGSMYLEDVEPHVPFATILFPQTTSDSLQTVNVSQEIQISDLPTFTKFNTWLLANESVRVTVKGDTNVQVSGISRKYPVTFEKTVDLKGLNGLSGLNVTDSTIALTADSRGDNFHGHATLPNPSVLTLELGNTSFTNFLNGAAVGTVFVDNMILYPGVNNLVLRANISQGPVLVALAKRPYCETGVLPFQLTGKDVVNHGQRLSYFADALAANNQTTNIDIGKTLKDSLNITIPCTS